MSYTRKPTRILSLLLAIVIMCGLVPTVSASANAAGGILDRDFSPIVDDGDAESQDVPEVWLSDYTYDGLDISIPFQDDSYMYNASSIHFLSVTDKYDTYLAFCIDPTGQIGRDYVTPTQKKWTKTTPLGQDVNYLNAIYKDPVVNWFYAGYYNTLLQRSSGCGDARLPIFTDEYLLVFYLLTQGVIWELSPSSTKLTDDSKYVDNVSAILSTILNTIKAQYPSVAAKIPNAVNLSESQIKATVQSIKSSNTRNFSFDFNAYKYDDTPPENLEKGGDAQRFMIAVPKSTSGDINTNFWIKINKRDKDTQDVLTGTKFKITCLQNIGSGISYYAEFDKDSVFTFSDPDTPIGPFSAPNGTESLRIKIEEVDASGNHVNDGKSYVIDIPRSKMGKGSSEAVEVSGTEPWENPTINPRVYFKVKKTDSETGEKLAGATYQVFESQADAQSGSNSKLSFTTKIDGDDVYGQIRYEDLTSLDELPKSYWLKEVKAPDGHKLDSTPFEVAVDTSKHYESAPEPETSVLVEVPETKTKNAPEDRPYVWIGLKKVDSADLHQLSGAVFGVYTDEQCENLTDTIEPEAQYTRYLVYLPRGSSGEMTLYLKELTAPVGYKPIDKKFSVTVNVEVNTDSDHAVFVMDNGHDYIENEKLPPIFLSLEKRDDDKVTKLSGAVFGVYTDSACTKLLGTITSSASGPVIQEFNTEATTLYVKEQTPPQHPDAGWTYKLDETVYTVSVSREANGTRETAAVIKALSGEEFITNTPVPPDPDEPDDPDPVPPSNPNAILYKYDSRTGEPLAGAIFEFTPLFSGHSSRFVTGADGSLALQWLDPDAPNYLAPGNYVVREVQAPEGYAKTDEVQTISFTILNEWDDEGNIVQRPVHTGPIVFSNDKLHQIKVLKQSNDGKVLAGAQFEVYKNGALVGTVTTDQTGYAEYRGRDNEGVDAGYYEFVEVKAPEGYMIPTNNRFGVYVDPSDNDTIEHIIVVTDYEYPDIVIEKTDKGTGTGLVGATFEVSIDGLKIGEFNTDNEGKIVLSYPDYGNFLDQSQDSWRIAVREIVPPQGYMIDDPTEHVLVLKKGETLASFEFSDTAYPGINIQKVDAEDNTGLAGAEIEVRIDGQTVGTYTTDSEGYIKLDQDTLGEFLNENNDSWTIQAREVKAPGGYLIDDTGWQTVELNYGQNSASFVFRDHKSNYIEILKTDAESGKGLEGATFEVRINNASIGTYSTDAAGRIMIDYETFKEFMPDDADSWVISAREVSAPVGYLVNDPNWQIAVLQKGQSHVTFNFEDSRIPKIVIRKWDLGMTKTLAGAQFEIVIDGENFGTFTTDDHGVISIDFNDYEDFLSEHSVGGWTVQIRETRAPAGYVISDDSWHTYRLYGGQSDIFADFMDDEYPMIRIQKTDSDTGKALAGAVFEVQIDGAPIGTYETNADGLIEIDYETYGEFLTKGKTSWTVSVREIEPPAGYLINDPSWKTSVLKLEQGLATFSFTDTMYPEIYIFKEDYYTGERLAGAEFEVRIDGNVLGTYTTDDNGMIHLDYETYKRFLNEDNYGGWTVQVRETKAPNGYLITDDTWHVAELKRGQSEMSFTFKDCEHPVIRILKVANGTNVPLAGAKFEVRIDNVPLDGGPFVTNEKGVIEIDYDTYKQFLADGRDSWTVSVREVEAPEGYMIDNTDWQERELKLKQGFANFVFSDTEYPEIEILKKDAYTNLPLEGALFEIQFDGAYFGSRVTDKNGRILITYEEYSRYLNAEEVDGSWTIAVREVMAPSGYLISDDTWHIAELKYGQSKMTFEFKDYQYPTIRIMKTVNGTNTGLAGAKFEVRIDGKDLAGTFVTDETGCIVIDYEHYKEFLTPGRDSWTVSVREVEAPDGYLLDDTSWHEAELRMGQSLSTFAFSDTEYPEIHIQKYATDSETPLAGAEFEVMIDGKILGTYTTDGNGHIKIAYEDYARFLNENNISSWTIQVREVKAPAGYVITDDTWHTVELEHGTSRADFVFRDTVYPEIRIQKLDAGTNKPLAGAVFEVRIDNKTLSPSNFVTDENGLIVIDYEHYKEFLTAGRNSWTVSVREVTPPDGYMNDDTDWHETELLLDQGLATFIFTDTKYPEIEILKKDAYTNKPLEGALFEIQFDGVTFGSRVTDKNGRILITYEEYSRYLNAEELDGSWTVSVREVKAPSGYLISDDTWHTAELKYGQSKMTFELEDYQYPTIRILKTINGTNTGLAGAKFQVRIDGKELAGTFVTDENGFIVIDYEHYKEFLTSGRDSWTVSVREIEAPDGYFLDDGDWHEAVLKMGQSMSTFMFSDTKYPEIEILKKDAYTNKPLEGALFEIQFDGVTFGSRVTDKNGRILITYEEYSRYLNAEELDGSWTVSVREVKAPSGYLISDDTWHTAELKYGQSKMTFELEDYQYPTIRILKTINGTNTGLAGAKFQVRIDGKELAGTFVTDENGFIVIDYEHYKEFLTSGRDSWTVSVREIEAPDGYFLDDGDWHEAVLKMGQSMSTFMFSDTKYPEIEILKKDAYTNKPLEGALFEIQFDGVTFGTRTTDKDGRILITYDEYSRYLDAEELDGSWTISVREVKAPSGYLISDDTWHTAELKYGQSKMTFELEDYQYPTIRILKTINGTNTGLAGAKFQVRIDGKELAGTFVTDENGFIVIDYEHYKEFLTSGRDSWTVSVREVEAPDGYLLDDDTWHESELKMGQSMATFEFSDTKYPEIHIQKYATDSEKPLAGAEFEVMIDGKVIGTYTTDANGHIKIAYEDYAHFLNELNLTSWTVQVREVKAPADYVITDDTWHTIELGHGVSRADFVFRDTVYPVIRILKLENGTNKALPGAVFEVKIDGDTLYPGTFTTDENGVIEIDYETYREFLGNDKTSWTVSVREVTPPDGYLLDDSDWHEAELHLEQGLGTFVFTDTKYPEIEILKKDAYTNKPLEGALFEIQFDGVTFGTRTTDKDGRILITYDEYSRYLNAEELDGSWTVSVREVMAPSGYLISDTTWHTSVLKFGQSKMTIEFEDYQYPTIRILKTINGTTTGLAGAKFQVRIDGKELAGTFVTDENGFIVIDYEHYKEFLTSGRDSWTVSVREVEAPDGYLLDDDTWHESELKMGQSMATFEFSDTKYPEIHIQKYATDSEKPLAGAEFEVMIDGKVIGTYTTDANGHIKIAYEDYAHFLNELNLTSWTVQVREVKAPAGYVITDDTWHTIELEHGTSRADFVFRDTVYPELRILKLDSSTNKPIQGAVFEIKVDGATLYPGSFVTDENGLIEIDYETYREFLGNNKTSWTVSVREVTPPDGYLLDDPDWHEAEFHLDQGLGTFVFLDTAYPKIEIIKRDRETGAVLPNTTFQILIDGRLFATRTTDENGRITVEYEEYRRFLDENNYDNWTITVTEVEAPDKYNKDVQASSGTLSLTQQLKIGQSLSAFEFLDTSYRDILVYKRDAIDGTPLAGATFRLHCVAGADLDAGNIADRELTTDETGYVIFKDVPNGTYEISEVTPPEGFQPANEIKHIVVTSDSDPLVEFSFENEPKSGIIIRKVDSLTKQPIEGVLFRITPLAPLPNVAIEKYTDRNGIIVLEDLDPGTYHIEEVKTVNGYTLNTTAQDVVVINQHEYFTVVFENDQKGMLNIFKTDAVSGKPISGAVFEIYGENGKYIAKATTGVNGYASIPGLDAGHYAIHEIQAPHGYVLDPNWYYVDVRVGENKTIEIENVPYSVLHVTKIDNVTRQPIAGVVFELYTGMVGSGAYTRVGQYVTDEHGLITTEPLTPGTYALKEISVPQGYLIDEAYHEVVVRAGVSNNIVIENQRAATLIVRKIDSKTGKPIPGAVFKVESADRMDLIGTLETDANGEAIFSGLTPGAYIVTETQAPDGYELSVPAEKTIFVEAGKRNYCDFADAAHGGLKIVLREQGTGKELYGGEFRVTRESDQIVVYDGSTDTTGAIVVGDLVPGWYFVEQIYAPEGYTMVTKELHVEVLSGEQQTVYFEDVTAGLIIEKYDSKDEKLMLEGARFQVKRDADGIVIGEYVTGKDGKVAVGNLVPGMYTITELVAPEGYTIDEGPKTIEVKAGTVAHVAFKDTALGGLTIRVLDTATQRGVAGAVVEIWRQNGNMVNSYTTDVTGVIISNKLPDGYYVLKLTHVPYGYSAAKTEATVQIKNGSMTTYTFEISSKASLKIVSKSTYGQAISGVTFIVSKPDGTVIGTYITSSDGSVVVTDLEPGWYVVTPSKAPANYSFSSTSSRNVYMSSGKQTVSEFELQVMASVRIRIVDGVTGNPVSGVRLQVREAGVTGNIYEFYSDNAGYVILDNSFLNGRYIVEMISAPDGYIVDTTPKSIELLAASTTDVVWKIYPVGGQIQVSLTSADYNAVLNQDAGTDLQGAVFEIQNADTYQVVGRIMTDARGVAASAALPVGRYLVTQVAPAPYYHMSSASSEVRIKMNNDIVRTYFTNKSVNLKTSVSVQSNNTISAGSNMRVDILSAANNSDVELDNFFVHVKVPTDAARASTFSTGAWNTAVSFKISVKTNMRDYYTLAANLISTNVYNYDLSTQALGLQSGEYVTDIRLEYGTVPAGFTLKTKMAFMEYVLSTVYDQYKLINRVEVGGQHNVIYLSTNPGNPEFVYSGEAGMGEVSGNSGAWTTAVALWTATVKSPVKLPDRLPQTGY